MRALGFDVKKKDVLKILSDLDKDETGQVDYKEFSDISEAFPFCSPFCCFFFCFLVSVFSTPPPPFFLE